MHCKWLLGWGENLSLHHSEQPIVETGTAQADGVLHYRPRLAGEVWIEVGPLLDPDRLITFTCGCRGKRLPCTPKLHYACLHNFCSFPAV